MVYILWVAACLFAASIGANGLLFVRYRMWQKIGMRSLEAMEEVKMLLEVSTDKYHPRKDWLDPLRVELGSWLGSVADIAKKGVAGKISKEILTFSRCPATKYMLAETPELKVYDVVMRERPFR